MSQVSLSRTTSQSSAGNSSNNNSNYDNHHHHHHGNSAPEQDHDGARDSHSSSSRVTKSPRLEAAVSCPAIPGSSSSSNSPVLSPMRRADSRELASATTPNTPSASSTAPAGISSSSSSSNAGAASTFGIDFKKIADFFTSFSSKSSPLFGALKRPASAASESRADDMVIEPKPSASAMAPQEFVDHIFDEHKSTHAILYSRFDDPYENETQETFPVDIVPHKPRADPSYRWYPNVPQKSTRLDAMTPSSIEITSMVADPGFSPSSTFQANAPEFLRRFNSDGELRPPSTGDMVGAYCLGEVAGIGAFSTVFQGHLLSDPRVRVAIKATEKTTLDQNLLENIHHEISLWKTLDHPNIVKFIDFVDTPTYIYVVCELCEEGCLYDYVINSPEGYLSEDEAKPVFVQLVQALSYLHSRGIYHGDIKLDNILLTKSGDIKICDFGFCQYVAERGTLPPEQRNCGGTLLYCAPEVLRGTVEVGCTSDIWSAGVTLFALVTGELPFDDDYEPRLKHQILAGKYCFPTDVPLTPELKSLVSWMLKTKVTDRPCTSEILKHPWLIGTV